MKLCVFLCSFLTLPSLFLSETPPDPFPAPACATYWELSSRHFPLTHFLSWRYCSRILSSSFLFFSLCFAGAHPEVPQFDSWVGKIRWRRDGLPTPVFLGFPCGSAGKESTCYTGDLGSIPGLGRSAGEGIGYPLQYSWASLVAQLVKNPPAKSETWVQSLGLDDPLVKGKATHSNILAWSIPWTAKSWGCKE